MEHIFITENTFATVHNFTGNTGIACDCIRRCLMAHDMSCLNYILWMPCFVKSELFIYIRFVRNSKLNLKCPSGETGCFFKDTTEKNLDVSNF